MDRETAKRGEGSGEEGVRGETEGRAATRPRLDHPALRVVSLILSSPEV